MDTTPSPLLPLPYEIVDVEVDKPLKKPQQIEALLTSAVPWVDLAPLVFAGTSDNTLHCFVPSGGVGSSNNPTSLTFLRWHTSYKKIFHACAKFLDSWGVYMTLMDSKLTMYALPLPLNPHLDGNTSAGIQRPRDAIVTVEDSKTTILFAANEDARVVACLTKQNTLKIYDWTVNRTLEMRVSHELPTVLATSKLLSSSSSAAAALPVSKMLVMGESFVLLLFKKEWCVVNVNSGKIVELQAASSAVAASLVNLEAIACATLLPAAVAASYSGFSSRPCDAFVAGKHFAVLIAVAVPPPSASYSGGDAAVKIQVTRVLEYSNLPPPKSAFHHHPFVLLDMQDRLAVYNVATMKLVHSGSGSSGGSGSGSLPIKAMYTGCTTVSLPSSSSSALSRELIARGLRVSFLTISAPFTVQLLQMTPIPTLLEQYMASKRLHDAVVLCELCPEEVALNEDEKRHLFAAFAMHVFQKERQFRVAMDYFWRARAEIDDVLALFPKDLLPRVSVVAQKSQQAKPTATAKPPMEAAVLLQGDELVQSLLALIEFLTKTREALLPPTTTTMAGQNPSQKQQQKLQLLDTVLLKCLVLITEQQNAPPHKQKLSYQLFELVQSVNFCEVRETEVFLRAHDQFDTLLSFYASRKLHRKTLELLEDLEKSSSASSAASTTATTSGGLRTPAEYLDRTAQYLKRLGQKKAELVFEFSRRVVFADPALGLSVFTHRDDQELDDTSDDEIEPSAILNHLKSCPIQIQSQIQIQPHMEATSAGGGGVTATEVAVEGDSSSSSLPLTESRFLAIEYITQVIAQGKQTIAPRLHDDAVYLLLEAIHSELHHASSSSSSSAPPPVLQTPARLANRVSSQRGLLGQLRRKLLHFLECPRAQYRPERMLNRTPNEMVDERAALLSRLGRHHEVLQLYALQLRDAPLAEAYCNKCYDTKQADSSIYSTLLRLYLRPTRSISSSGAVLLSSSSSPPKQPIWQRSTSLQLGTGSSSTATGTGGGVGGPTTSPSEAVMAAINVLNKYADRIDVATALDLLPADVPVSTLTIFFGRVLERQVERYRNGQIKNQLAKMENFKVREKLTTKRKESVTVWSSHCCYVCGKKLGVGTFVRLPQAGGGTLTLVHYACQPAVAVAARGAAAV